jgi:hypothetical protein
LFVCLFVCLFGTQVDRQATLFWKQGFYHVP